jgi:hypothetical protein
MKIITSILINNSEKKVYKNNEILKVSYYYKLFFTVT